jgi:hypothetical protein
MGELTIAGSGAATKNEIRDVVNGDHVITVGDSGRFQTIQDAITYIATLPSKVKDEASPFDSLGTVTVAANGSTITGTSTFFNNFTTSLTMAEFNGDGNLYPVKRVHHTEEAELFGGITGGIAALSTIEFYTMIPYTILLIETVSYSLAFTDLDFTALNGYSITLAGIGVGSSVLQFEPASSSSTLVLPKSAYITLRDFTIKSRRVSPIDIEGGAGSVLTVSNFAMGSSGSPASPFSVGGVDGALAGLIIDSYDAYHSQKGPDAFRVDGYAYVARFRNHALNIDEALQLSSLTDNGYEQPYIIESLYVLGKVVNTAFGCIHVSLAADGDQDKNVIINNPVIVNLNASLTGTLIHIEQGRTSAVPTGSGTINAWITGGQLNDITGSVNSTGITARYNSTVIYSNVYMNVNTDTAVFNGATITLV